MSNMYPGDEEGRMKRGSGTGKNLIMMKQHSAKAHFLFNLHFHLCVCVVHLYATLIKSSHARKCTHKPNGRWIEKGR